MNATCPGTSPVLAPGQFYGAVAGTWRTELVTLSIVHHPQPRQVPRHSHEHMFLALLLAGGYREWVGDREIVYQPLTVVFHPEHLDHRDEIQAAGTTFFTVEIRPALLGERARRHRGLSTVQDLRGGPLVWAMLRLHDHVGHQGRDPVECEEPVSEILDELLGHPVAPAARPRWLARVEDKLRSDFRDRVSLHALATLAGVHPVHVARVFRRHHGGSIRDLVHRLRVLHASRLITRRASSLAAAALDSGFCDQSHMNRVFVSVTGMTPAAFRRSHGR